jgi:hypothetical protein
MTLNRPLSLGEFTTHAPVRKRYLQVLFHLLF